MRFTKIPVLFAAVLLLATVFIWQLARPTDALRDRPPRHVQSERFGKSRHPMPWVDRKAQDETDEGILDDPDDCSDCVITPPRMIECEADGSKGELDETARSWLLVSAVHVETRCAAVG